MLKDLCKVSGWRPSLAILFVIVTSGSSLVFLVHPKNVDVIRGHRVTLGCTVTPNQSDVVVYWTIDEQPIGNTSRRHQVGSDLVITRADPRLDGNGKRFQCVALNMTSRYSIKSLPATINVLCK